LSRLIYAVQVVVTRKNGWMMLFKNGTLLNYTMGENAGPPTVPLIVEGVTQLAVSQRGDPIQMLVRFANGSLLVRSKPWVRTVVVVHRWFVCLSQLIYSAMLAPSVSVMPMVGYAALELVIAWRNNGHFSRNELAAKGWGRDDERQASQPTTDEFNVQQVWGRELSQNAARACL
jgi:hypothetical protein